MRVVECIEIWRTVYHASCTRSRAHAVYTGVSQTKCPQAPLNFRVLFLWSNCLYNGTTRILVRTLALHFGDFIA